MRRSQRESVQGGAVYRKAMRSLESGLERRSVGNFTNVRCRGENGTKAEETRLESVIEKRVITNITTTGQ